MEVSFQIDDFLSVSKEIGSLDDASLKEYVISRVLWLEKRTKEQKLGITDDNRILSIYKGYISSNSPIKSSKSAEAFYLDNINIYYDFIKQYKEHINEDNLIKMFQDLQNYFTDTFGLTGSQKKRNEVYCEYSSELQNKLFDVEGLSVHKLTEKGAAMCLERSAILQNILSLLGLNSYFIYGKLEKFAIDNVTSELHSYNIVKITSDDYLIYDISNPLSLEYDNTKYYFPAINVIGEGQLNDLIDGCNYVFDNKQVENLFDCKATVLNEIKRIYTIG
ncbi:MAG: hypothetical protein HFI87_04365 [Bacilli bacterium]|nr:hypothetical protein [Bacilli bacterium]